LPFPFLPERISFLPKKVDWQDSDRFQRLAALDWGTPLKQFALLSQLFSEILLFERDIKSSIFPRFERYAALDPGNFFAATISPFETICIAVCSCFLKRYRSGIIDAFTTSN
jgi:hypothetical protein